LAAGGWTGRSATGVNREFTPYLSWVCDIEAVNDAVLVAAVTELGYAGQCLEIAIFHSSCPFESLEEALDTFLTFPLPHRETQFPGTGFRFSQSPLA
jgi:hypothetical protein